MGPIPSSDTTPVSIQGREERERQAAEEEREEKGVCVHRSVVDIARFLWPGTVVRRVRAV